MNQTRTKPNCRARDVNDSINSATTISRKRQERLTGPANTATTIAPAAKRYGPTDTPEKIRQAKQSSELIPVIQRQGNNPCVGLNAQQTELLLELATVGCCSHMGERWSMNMLNAAIRKGAHPAAMLPEAATQLRAETLEKVEQGYARLIRWSDIKDKPPPNLKISPIAAIPHKSRTWRMILDLSHGVTLHGIKYA